MEILFKNSHFKVYYFNGYLHYKENGIKTIIFSFDGLNVTLEGKPKKFGTFTEFTKSKQFIDIYYQWKYGTNVFLSINNKLYSVNDLKHSTIGEFTLKLIEGVYNESNKDIKIFEKRINELEFANGSNMPLFIITKLNQNFKMDLNLAINIYLKKINFNCKTFQYFLSNHAKYLVDKFLEKQLLT